jgi:glucose/arabinose dehydrogenase
VTAARRLPLVSLLSLSLSLGMGSARAQDTPVFDPSSFTLRLEPTWTGLRQPTDVVNAGDGSARLFVLEKAGRIRLIDGSGTRAEPFLDITSLVRSSGSEQGLLGLAFHPRYASNGLFYVNYTDVNGDTAVARYQVSSDPNVADSTTARQLLWVAQPAANHNGGDLVFGPDGYLYIGLGDGGGGGDTFGNSQRPDALLAKMLRVDVDRGEPYGIPPDNPFVNSPGFRPEIWAWGLRNPWRYTFDRVTGELYIADVGQNVYEEVDVQPAGQGGQNYGWNIMEGFHCFRPRSDCQQTGLTPPVLEYDHSQGCSITGGSVYRGRLQPRLYGAYLYGDYCSGHLWAGWRTGDGAWHSQMLADTSARISSFGEDESGELFLASLSDGTIYRLVADSR